MQQGGSDSRPTSQDNGPEQATSEARGRSGCAWGWRGVGIAVVGIVLAMAAIESGMGRLMWGPDGRFGWWSGDIWSDQNSQRVADAYSFSHIGHGILFFAGLWWVARGLPLRVRFLLAVLLEAGWEVLENSPLIINRYREATIALGYEGDSILNSVSDVFMMAFGFLLAWRLPVWGALAVFLGMEIGCAVWIRDNLTLNVIMLLYPVEAIRTWQMGGRSPL